MFPPIIMLSLCRDKFKLGGNSAPLPKKMHKFPSQFPSYYTILLQFCLHSQLSFHQTSSPGCKQWPRKPWRHRGTWTLQDRRGPRLYRSYDGNIKSPWAHIVPLSPHPSAATQIYINTAKHTYLHMYVVLCMMGKALRKNNKSTLYPLHTLHSPCHWFILCKMEFFSCRHSFLHSG